VVAKGLSRSFQIISIFQDLTVFENIRVTVQARSPHRFNFFSVTEELEDINVEAERVIATVGLGGRESMKASSLSHGDQRLLEIGISLAANPELLLLDEPLAGLSSRERPRVAKLIRQLSGEHTILLIEHDIDRVLTLSDRITVLNQGKVIAEGTPQEIQQNRPLAPNTIFSEFVTNRVQASLWATRSGFLGIEANKRADTQTVLVTDGTNTVALCHVQDTPLTLGFPGTDWEGLAGTLGRDTTFIPIRSLSFYQLDPRVAFMPVTPAEVRQLGCMVYRTSSDPYKFQDAVLVGAQEGY
jgi:ABC-type branched-subunit amino acid transport system ATPase component